MKALNGLRNSFYLTAATATVVAFAMGDAFAQDGGNTLGSMADDFDGQIESFGKLLLIASFLLGVFLVFQGILKLKQSHDDEGRTKMSSGFWRLGLGGVAMALGAFSGVLTSTLGFGDLAPTGSEVRPF